MQHNSIIKYLTVHFKYEKAQNPFYSHKTQTWIKAIVGNAPLTGLHHQENACTFQSMILGIFMQQKKLRPYSGSEDVSLIQQFRVPLVKRESL